MLGEENPISHLSRIKNPDLPYLSIAAALRAYVLRPASLDVSASLGTTASFSGLLRPGFTTSQLCLANCLSCLVAVAFVSHILTIPCMLSLVDHCHIRHASFPPKAYQRRKGDSSINYYYTTRRAGYVCAWVSFVPRPQLLGPRQGSPLLKRRQENRTVLSRLPGSIMAVKRRVTACSVGNRPRGLGGAVYLLVCLFIRVYLFINIRGR